MKTKNHSKNDQTSNPQPDPQQKRSVLWIGVILFISGWIFFLGVIVGRGTAPALFDYKKIETEITTLAKTFTDSRKAQNDKETDILTTQAGLEYPEELKKKTDTAEKMLIPALENPVRPTETPKPPSCPWLRKIRSSRLKQPKLLSMSLLRKIRSGRLKRQNRSGTAASPGKIGFSNSRQA